MLKTFDDLKIISISCYFVIIYVVERGGITDKSPNLGRPQNQMDSQLFNKFEEENLKIHYM